MIDFDAGAQAVLDCALQYAEMHGASIFFLHVVERDSFLLGMDEVVLALNPEERAEEARIALLTFMDQSDRRGLEASPIVRMGRMEQEITAGAEEVGADLIILAEARSRFLGSAWGRSTAEKVVRRAICPVLVLQAAEKQSQNLAQISARSGAKLESSSLRLSLSQKGSRE